MWIISLQVLKSVNHHTRTLCTFYKHSNLFYSLSKPFYKQDKSIIFFNISFFFWQRFFLSLFLLVVYLSILACCLGLTWLLLVLVIFVWLCCSFQLVIIFKFFSTLIYNINYSQDLWTKTVSYFAMDFLLSTSLHN